MAAEDLHIGAAGSSARHHAEGLHRRHLAKRNWSTGADGERDLASFLAGRCPQVPMLHDRAASMSRANIDHIAIAPTGVYVIDCKRYRGKIEVTRPVFGPRKLKIKGRDRTLLIDGLERQVAQVEVALAAIGVEVPIHGCLCFLAPEGRFAGVGLPIVRTLKIAGSRIYHARRLAKRLNRSGPIGLEQAITLREELAQRLGPALIERPGSG